MRIEPFAIEVSDEVLTDLRARIRRTRWPDPAPSNAWEQGVELGYLQALAAYWADGFDWRAQERRLNAFDQYRADVDGVLIHFVHARAPGGAGFPLILTHGWPSTFVELLPLVPCPIRHRRERGPSGSTGWRGGPRCRPVGTFRRRSTPSCSPATSRPSSRSSDLSPLAPPDRADCVFGRPIDAVVHAPGTFGCGHGWSTIALAKAYPHAEAVGYDGDAASTRLAVRGRRSDFGGAAVGRQAQASVAALLGRYLTHAASGGAGGNR